MSVVAFGTVLFNEASVKRIRADADQLASLMDMRKSVFELRTGLLDAETGQRGYLLTRDAAYLQPYRDSVGKLALLTSSLIAATDPEDHALLAQVKKVDALRADKVTELSATIKLLEEGERADAFLLLRTGDGRKLMDAFRTESQALLEQLDSRAALLRASSSRNVQWSRVAFAALGMLTLALLVVAIRLLVKDYWRLESDRQEAVIEQQRLEDEVKERTAELSNLTTYLQSVAEHEKAELAHNLHDELGGLLTAAKMDLAWLQGRASATEPQVRSKLEALGHGIDEAMNVKRRVVENLRPALLEHFGLPTALQAYFDETCGKAGLKCRTTVPESVEQIPQELAIALFRVAQESLTNIIRHAGAQNVAMTLEIDEHQYRLRISDDGVGMGSTRTRASLSHGLAGMRHRIESMRGQFWIGPNQPCGTQIEVVVPRLPTAVTEVSRDTTLDA
jgi:protein-histidine pros-kinase